MTSLQKLVMLVSASLLTGCMAATDAPAASRTMAVQDAPDPAVIFANANASGAVKYKEGYFGSGDTRLHYVEAGEGPLIILYHGFPSFWYSWFDQMEVLKNTHRVVAVDGLGSGFSAKPQNLGPYKLPALAQQVDDLARHLGSDEKFILAGHDWGSVLALSYAQAYPERLHKVVGMNAPPLNMFLKYLNESAEQRERSSYMIRIKATSVAQLQAANGAKRIAEQAYGNLEKRGDLTPDEVALFRDAMSAPKTMNAMMNWYRANIPAWDQISEDDMWPSPGATINVPTLVIWGEEDRVAVPGLVQELAQPSPNLKFVNLPGVNHWTSMEQPDLATKALMDFLNE